MAQYRERRVAQEIQKELTDIFRKRVKDPRLAELTITEVKVTGDLQQATVYYSILSDLASDAEKVERGLTKASGIIRKELGQRLSIYKTPELIFERDSSVQYGDHIDQLLRNLNKD